ncbi:unnamed protein product [Medioppia subpectinata]|uniref:Enoyl reductase (ER) domain-containing protein n=1 Tax=Medioppia subpectinata TaxID=1979941 RepID=A0A7R9KMU3_9ACAR|nr:unnamed protein product [Medioppia subpectinata]CAG2106476.1 unnamed protein product [Medioppia subpectinata]
MGELPVFSAWEKGSTDLCFALLSCYAVIYCRESGGRLTRFLSTRYLRPIRAAQQSAYQFHVPIIMALIGAYLPETYTITMNSENDEEKYDKVTSKFFGLGNGKPYPTTAVLVQQLCNSSAKSFGSKAQPMFNKLNTNNTYIKMRWFCNAKDQGKLGQVLNLKSSETKKLRDTAIATLESLNTNRSTIADAFCNELMRNGFDLMFTDCLLGGEYAGRRADTGQRVMGIEFGRCIATQINACVLNMAPIPDHWSMAEAVTVLNSYSTVYYALIKKANNIIKKGESVLIHSGAGSVGQAAINVCQHYGCDIYVTVETEEEKQFLIKEYNIPENRIFCSRDMQFKSEIIEATNVRGINVVLNSLTGKKSDLSFECLAKSGRFIELKKLDHGQNGHNRKRNPYDFDGDFQYIGVSANLLITDIGFLPEFYEWIQQNSCLNGFVRPLSYTVFGAKRVVNAFRYMTTGRHIEKLMI